MNLAENPVALALLFLLAAFALGTIYLWIKDRLYTVTTGKPASERVREQKEKAALPLTRSGYRFRIVFYLAGILFWALAAYFENKHRVERTILSIGWMTSFIWSLVATIKKRKRQGFLEDYSSEAAT